MNINKLTTLLNATLFQTHRSEAEEELQRVSMLFGLHPARAPIIRIIIIIIVYPQPTCVMHTVEGYVIYRTYYYEFGSVTNFIFTIFLFGFRCIRSRPGLSCHRPAKPPAKFENQEHGLLATFSHTSVVVPLA